MNLHSNFRLLFRNFYFASTTNAAVQRPHFISRRRKCLIKLPLVRVRYASLASVHRGSKPRGNWFVFRSGVSRPNSYVSRIANACYPEYARTYASRGVAWETKKRTRYIGKERAMRAYVYRSIKIFIISDGSSHDVSTYVGKVHTICTV